MKASLKLCLLFSLISPVKLLTCKMCLRTNATECPIAFDEKCRSSTSCRSVSINSSVFFNRKMATKSCTYQSSCDPGYYSLTTSGGGFLNMLVDCCTTNKCNTKNPKLPSEPMEPNGLECEGCHAENQGLCEGTEMVKCLGDQTKCISMNVVYAMVGAVNSRNFSTKGCATPLMCDQRKVNRNMALRLMTLSAEVNCTDAVLSTEPSSLA